ncbi:NAD(P)-binding protein [Xylariaceae sp. FL0016]|nr:NAD(P)-binding protein [Xylariaceae sp. FL0016]
MPTYAEIKSMVVGQAFGSTHVPQTDLSGKTFIVTGSNTGLGLEAAMHLARLKVSTLILACRNTAKGEAAKDAILETTACHSHTHIQVWPLDLASHDSVIAFGRRVRSSELPRLDGFIANAGVEVQQYSEAEGLELHLTVNVVSTFMSAMAALPKMRQTSARHGVQTAMTFVGSMYHIFGPDRELDVADDVDIFAALSDTGEADMPGRYALSKLMEHQCHAAFARAVAQSHGGGRLTVNIANPGWCVTELARSKDRAFHEKFFSSLIGWTAEKGSRAVVYAALQGEESHGRYLSECQCKEESAYVTSDRGRRIQAKMWKDLCVRVERVAPEIASFAR